VINYGITIPSSHGTEFIFYAFQHEKIGRIRLGKREAQVIGSPYPVRLSAKLLSNQLTYSMQIKERHSHDETTCSCTHAEEHPPLKVEALLHENQCNVLHHDDNVLHSSMTLVQTLMLIFARMR
jgi:hypothetical protein